MTLMGPFMDGLRSEILLDKGAFRRDDGTTEEGRRQGTLDFVEVEDLDDDESVVCKEKVSYK